MRKGQPKVLWTPDRCQKARQLYEAGNSLTEVAAVLQSSADRVAAAIRRVGGTIRRRGAPMERNGFWRGGRRVDKGGYVLLRVPKHPQADGNGYVREHRLVFEKYLGRYLESEEVVHHRNGDPGDNRLENLELFATNGEHLAQELAGRCPQWSVAGRERIRQGRDKQAERARQRTMTTEEFRLYRNAQARAAYARRRAAAGKVVRPKSKPPRPTPDDSE